MKFNIVLSIVVCGLVLSNNAVISKAGVLSLPGDIQLDVPTYTLKSREIQPKYYKDVPVSFDLQNLISELSKRFDIPEALVYSTMELESDFQPSCESNVGAKGLMQLSDETFSDMKKKMRKDCYDLYERIEGNSIWDNETNIIVSMYYMNYLKLNLPDNSQYSWDYILTAYNRGITGAQKWYDYSGTYSSSYSKQILDNLSKYN